jgi:hypothetical protein
MSYLQKGKYCGIDPNRWLIDDAIRFEVGETVLATKAPRFVFSDDLNLTVFGESFDYIQAHSVLTHMPKEMISRLFSQLSLVLGKHGIFVGTYVPGTNDYSGAAWAYPEIVSYRWETLCNQAEDFKLHTCRLNWPHPRQHYFAITRTKELILSILSARRGPYSPNLSVIENEST